MKKLLILLPTLFFGFILPAQEAGQANLPFKMEELTSPQFTKAVELSGGVCIIPLGHN